jgi:predicted dehydrogenase
MPQRFSPFSGEGDLPEIDIRQLLALTDDTGMLQHASFATPDLLHGYCTDDNARALIAGVMYGQIMGFAEVVVPLQRYLSFLGYAMDPRTGRFRNFMSYDRRWLEDVGSEDSHGRAVWGLSVAARQAPNESARGSAERLLGLAFPACGRLSHIRSWAFTLMGCDAYLAEPGEGNHAGLARELRLTLSERLFDAWRENASDDWPWWEDMLTYANAKLAHALILSGRSLARDDMLEAGLRSLRWLLDLQTAEEGHLSIIGNRGWMKRGGRRARFDQQPLEAQGIVQACLDAARVTGEEKWVREAERAFEWFLGMNDLGAALYDPETGGCQDGLTEGGVNDNQGAESTLAYILSVLELHRYHMEKRGQIRIHAVQPVGYAILGAGSLGEFVLSQCAGMEGFEPRAIWNRTPHRAKALAERYGIRFSETLDDILSDPRVRLVHVATVPSTHAELVAAALAAGKHVLVEKPPATTLMDANRMMETARTKKLILAVDLVMRYGPLWEPVRKLIKSRLLGACLAGDVLNCAGDDRLGENHWFWDEELSGGIFVEHGIHHFDLMRSWLGAGQVTAAQVLYRPGTTLIDQARSTMLHGMQTTVGYYHGFHQPSCLDRQRLRLVFELGDITLYGWVANRMEMHAALQEEAIERIEEMFEGATVTTLRRFAGPAGRFVARGREHHFDREVRINWAHRTDPQATYGLAMRALISDVLVAVRDPGHRMRAVAEDGRAALETALAATRLAKERVP